MRGALAWWVIAAAGLGGALLGGAFSAAANRMNRGLGIALGLGGVALLAMAGHGAGGLGGRALIAGFTAALLGAVTAGMGAYASVRRKRTR